MRFSRHKLLALSIFLINMYVTGMAVKAEEVIISWDPNSESDLAGYYVYMGETSDAYTGKVDVGNITQFIWGNLESSKTYYFAVAAYDLSNNESDLSEEVSAKIDPGDISPPELVNVGILGLTQVDVQFSEPVDKNSAEAETNYAISKSIQVLGALLDEQNTTLVHLLTSSHVLGESYIIRIRNVKDLAGNLIDSATSKEYSTPNPPPPVDNPDIIKPQIKNIILVDISNLEVEFTEKIEKVSAETESNYTIDQGVQILQASLNAAETKVQLTTSQHRNGLRYKVTVNNVTDLASNAIVANSSISYDVNVGDVDNKPPEIVSVLTNGVTQIDINFSESVDKESAENKSNYTITPQVEIVGAILNDNNVTIHLITGSHTTEVDYSIAVANIKDRANVPNTMTASNSLKYTFEDKDVDFESTPNPGTTPQTFALYQNYPNPFNPETDIRFFVDKQRDVELKIYNTLGQLVKTLVKEEMQPGFHTIVWDATNNANKQVPSGMYIYSLEVKREIEKGDMLVNVSLERRVKRMTLVR